MKMLHKVRIALAVAILALAAVSAVDSASARGLRTENYDISTADWYWWP
jgi:hypothetical protein